MVAVDATWDEEVWSVGLFGLPFRTIVAMVNVQLQSQDVAK